MKDFILSIQFIFKPSFWIMNEPFCPIHEAKLVSLMREHKFTNIGRHTAMLGDTEIWISNYPYAVGIDKLCRFSRPSRLTIKRLMRKISKEA